jgi:hypothetical protein
VRRIYRSDFLLVEADPKVMAQVHVSNESRQVVYQRLDPTENQIRILELQPARHGINDKLVCRLVRVALTDDLEYIAISSLFGDPANTEQITVNGRQVTLPATLCQALRHVRAVFLSPSGVPGDQQQTALKKQPNWLLQAFRQVRSILPDSSKTNHDKAKLCVWLDAICIDRQDGQERGQQLVHMGMVYRSAKMVVAWLGMKGDLSDLCVQTMKEVEDAFPPHFGELQDKVNNPQNYAPCHEWMANITHIWTNVHEGQYYPALLDFVERPYFNRSWILDEISLARYPAFLIGDRIVSWRQVLLLNRLMEELRDNDSDMFPVELRPLLVGWPLGTIYTLLKQYETRQILEEREKQGEEARSLTSYSSRKIG